MGLQITINGTTYTPTTIDGYQSMRSTQNVVNEVFNRANPDVALRTALLRSGPGLTVGFQGATAETASKTFADACSGPYVAQLTTTAPDPTTVAMYFVATGDVGRELEDTTRNAWIVRLPWQEVALS